MTYGVCIKPNLIKGLRRPCGKCVACQQAQGWATVNRVLLDLIPFPRVWFVTLTFRRHPTPDGFKQAVRRFRDSLRAKMSRRTGERGGVVFHVFPERGAARGRLHVHLLISGPASLKARDISLLWGEGFTDLKLISSCGKVRDITGKDGSVMSAARYLAVYCKKAAPDASLKRSFPRNSGARLLAETAELLRESLSGFPEARIIVMRPHGSTTRNEDGSWRVDRSGEGFAMRALLKKADLGSQLSLPHLTDEERAIFDRRETGTLISETGRWEPLPQGGCLRGNNYAVIEETAFHQANWHADRIRAHSLTGREHRPGVPEIRALSSEEIEGFILAAPPYCRADLSARKASGQFSRMALAKWARSDPAAELAAQARLRERLQAAKLGQATPAPEVMPDVEDAAHEAPGSELSAEERATLSADGWRYDKTLGAWVIDRPG